MAITNPQTVILAGTYIHKEGTVKASTTILPGHLLDYETDGKIKLHGGAGLNASRMFAIENAMMGLGITDAYVSTTTVLQNILFGVFHNGSEVYALVPAGAAAIAIGDWLESVGDGTLRLSVSDTAVNDTQREGSVARALEAVNNSGGGTPVRIRVEIV